jgi:hypothetical protein
MVMFEESSPFRKSFLVVQWQLGIRKRNVRILTRTVTTCCLKQFSNTLCAKYACIIKFFCLWNDWKFLLIIFKNYIWHATKFTNLVLTVKHWKHFITGYHDNMKSWLSWSKSCYWTTGIQPRHAWLERCVTGGIVDPAVQ